MNPLKRREVSNGDRFAEEPATWSGHVETKQDFIAHIRFANETLDEKVTHLCKLSGQLVEYSRTLKQKSDEINQRLQSCINVRRAA